MRSWDGYITDVREKTFFVDVSEIRSKLCPDETWELYKKRIPKKQRKHIKPGAYIRIDATLAKVRFRVRPFNKVRHELGLYIREQQIRLSGYQEAR